ncbi:nuclear transport factor 2 family protein [Nocardioides sp. J54]|uniref:nuclear transport factor 2 family protein n=1 Tax=Nocardioides sp. J54 TaxID=935866 RepID=UPI0004B3C8A0|nr:nuclear transport factor 2 family protein [Nocardioides sp. J54]
MSAVHSDFRAAVEARDVDAMRACLADDVVFRSPVAHKPYPGKAITGAILANVIEVFEDFRYVRELGDDAGHALVFEAKVSSLDLTGCDFLVLDDDGLITDFMVMVRPLKAAQALAEAMGARFDAIVEQAGRG